MNRIIKFRAWDDKNKVMIENVSLLNSIAHVCQNRTFDFEEMRGDYKILDIHTDNIMQFTGLKDLNGKDIYEGDIIQDVYDGLEEPEIHVGHVIYDNLFGYMLDFGSSSTAFSDFDVEEFEIIGNVFQNPELIEKEKPND